MTATFNGDLGRAWEELPESARLAIIGAVYTLAGGFTGQIVLDCGQGGVTWITESRKRKPIDLDVGIVPTPH